MSSFAQTISPMRSILFILGLLFPTFVFSQKILESQEWCPHKYTVDVPSLMLLQDGRSDSIDIIKTSVNLNLLNAPEIKANCLLELQGKVNGLTEIRLDLEGLTVDSVYGANQALWPFVQTGNSLVVQFPQTLNTGQTLSFHVVYHGIPPTDASGWGGFYNTGGYVFNLGVGFAADPHSFGRAWFPCFDNFVERCIFELDAISQPGKPTYGNGVLLSQQSTATQEERHWLLTDPIPSYLACFASGPYTSFKRTYTGALGPIPVEIAAAPADTVKVRNSYINLPKAIEVFEYWFGPYLWDKIGYSLVPFNYGAMEHATNVAIGRSYINGTLTYETLWAHELSHHWWGDLATCTTAEDMWLNEGWASYSEHLFTEKVYGVTAYRNAVRANHLTILQNAHIEEGGYRAVSGLPHNLTYGLHVYNKGASVAHNLRGYLGDSLFRVGCREALGATNFKDWSSADFRDKMEAATGKNLHDFFEDWVFSGGYPDFTVDSMKLLYSPVDAPTIARVFVKQKLRGAPHFHQNVPLEFTFLMSNGVRQTRSGNVSGENTVLEFEFPAFGPAPQNVFVNTNLKILQARAEGEKMIKTAGGSNFQDAKFNLTVNAVGADSVLFRVEHHFAAPDNAGANPNGYLLTNRYWTIQSAGSDFPTGFDAKGVMVYDGRGDGDQLDTELFAIASTDSLLLLYRPGPGAPWREYPTYTKASFSPSNDNYGQFRPTFLLTGEYTIGRGVVTSATNTPNQVGRVTISPNPAKGFVVVTSASPFHTATLIRADGRVEKTWQFMDSNQVQLDLSAFPAGQYWLQLVGDQGTSLTPLVRQ